MNASNAAIKPKAKSASACAELTIRVQSVDGTVESFNPSAEVECKKLWDSIDPDRMFGMQRLVVAGEHFKSVYAAAKVVRVDFVQQNLGKWDFPGGYADLVELTERDFRKHAHLDEPEKMAKRKQCTPVGDLLVSFLHLRMMGGSQIYLMAEFPVKLPAENQSFMRFLLSGGSFHFRLVGGGFAVINLANLISYTTYPGVADVPSDTWLAEPTEA